MQIDLRNVELNVISANNQGSSANATRNIIPPTYFSYKTTSNYSSDPANITQTIYQLALEETKISLFPSVLCEMIKILQYQKQNMSSPEVSPQPQQNVIDKSRQARNNELFHSIQQVHKVRYDFQVDCIHLVIHSSIYSSNDYKI